MATMPTSAVPTIDFSPAKTQLSELMTQGFHGHQPRIVSRHRGKERMLLVRPDDLLAMLGEVHFDVRAIYDQAEVSLVVPDLGVIGAGTTLDDATDDLLAELEAYATEFFGEPARYLATSRGTHGAALLRFALDDEEGRRRMLGIDEPDTERPTEPALTSTG